MRRRLLIFFSLSLCIISLGTKTYLGYASCPPANLVVTITSSPTALIDPNNPQSPRVATISARVRNTGSAPAENLMVFIGDGSTPGRFPVTGTHSLELLGPVSEARRSLGTLPAGATQTLFWPVRYPATENTAYSYTVWASADGGCGDSQIAALQIRRAAAGSASRVRPASHSSITVEPNTAITPGELVTVTIRGFDLGAIGPGPEAVEDAWLQPISNPNFDPSCLRLVSSLLLLKSINSEPYRDQLYFSGIGSHNPPPNYAYSTDDYVKYTFIGLRRCTTQLQPYQQIAFGSGHQYNVDIGAINLNLQVDDRTGGLALDSSVIPTIGGANTTLTYTIAYGNRSGAPLGAANAPLLITARIPQNIAAYIPDSSKCSAHCLKLWSSDEGETFAAVEPAPGSVNAVRWILLDAVPSGQNPAGTVSFQLKSLTNGELCTTVQSAINETIVIETDMSCVNSSTDLQIALSGSSTVRPGGALRSAISYRNSGPSVAEDVAITVTLPAEVQFVQSSPPAQSTSGPVLTYRLGSIAAGHGGSIVLQVAVSPQVSNGSTLTHTVQIATATTESETANNTASFTTTVGSRAPQLIATARVRTLEDAPPLGPGAGDVLEYAVTIKNTGAVAATNVLFTATPDPHTQLFIGSLSSSTGQIISGNAEGDRQIRISMNHLAPSASETIEFRVRIKEPLSPGLRRVRLQGIVSSNELPDILTDDPHTAIPEDPTDFSLSNGPLLKAEKSYSIFNDLDGNGLPSPGDILKYTVLIENLGAESANSVVLTDGLDPQLTLVVGSVMTTQGDVLSGNEVGERFVRVSVGSVAPKGKITITYRVGINPDVSHALAFVGGQALLSAASIPSRPTDDPSTPAEDDPTLTLIWNAPHIYIAQRAYLKVDANGDGLPNSGDTLGYAVTLINHGNADAQNAFFSSTPDLHTQLIVGSVRASQGSVSSGNGLGDTTVGIALDPLPRNGQAQISFDVLIKRSLPSTAVSLVNQSLVNVPGGGSFVSDDPATLALSDPTITPVGPSPFLHFTKSVYMASDDDRNGMVSAGELLEYVLTVTNLGAQDALGLNLSDALGNEMRIMEASVKNDHGLIASGARSNAHELLVSVGTLGAHGGRARISFQVRLQNPLSDRTITNRAFIWGTNLSEQPSDDPRTPVLGDATALTAGEFFILCGDVDSDGDVDLEDARLAGQAAIGALQLTERQRAAADVAPPFGVIDARDATAIAEIAQGYRLRCPIPSSTSTNLQGLEHTLISLRVERFLLEPRGRAVVFQAQGQGIQEILLKIFNLAGEQIFYSDWHRGSELEWRGLTNDGRLAANGIYLYLVFVRGAEGSVARSRVQKLVILR